jgi:phage/plasmid-like protein (TIGR03299 family)
MIPVKDKFALTRNTDEAVFDVVSKGWQENQNASTIDFFSKFTKAGHMSMETAGSLAGGKFVWALARINKDFALSGPGRKKQADDEVRGYLLLSMPHAWGYANTTSLTPVRVVCWNTLNYALGKGLKGKGGQVFRLNHSHAFDDKAKEQAEIALGLGVKQMEEFKDAATLLAGKKATDEQVTEYFFEVTKYDPKEAELKKDGEPKQKPLMLRKIMAALENAPGQQLGAALGTWWGAYNAVSYVIDHESGNNRGTALKSAWLGPNAALKRDAFQLALAKAA